MQFIDNVRTRLIRLLIATIAFGPTAAAAENHRTRSGAQAAYGSNGAEVRGFATAPAGGYAELWVRSVGPDGQETFSRASASPRGTSTSSSIGSVGSAKYPYVPGTTYYDAYTRQPTSYQNWLQQKLSYDDYLTYGPKWYDSNGNYLGRSHSSPRRR